MVPAMSWARMWSSLPFWCFAEEGMRFKCERRACRAEDWEAMEVELELMLEDVVVSFVGEVAG